MRGTWKNTPNNQKRISLAATIIVNEGVDECANVMRMTRRDALVVKRILDL